MSNSFRILIRTVFPDPDLDPAKSFWSDQNRIRLHNTAFYDRLCLPDLFREPSWKKPKIRHAPYNFKIYDKKLQMFPCQNILMMCSLLSQIREEKGRVDIGGPGWTLLTTAVTGRIHLAAMATLYIGELYIII
jgi:hypothetical protein